MTTEADDVDDAPRLAAEQMQYYQLGKELYMSLYLASEQYGQERCSKEGSALADKMIEAASKVPPVVGFDALCKVILRACESFSQHNNLSGMVMVYALQQTVASVIADQEMKVDPSHVN